MMWGLLVIASIKPLNNLQIFLCDRLQSNYGLSTTFANSEIPQSETKKNVLSEQDTLKVSKNRRIWGVEFIGASIPIWLNDLLLWEIWYNVAVEKGGKEARWPFAIWYAGGNTLIGASSVLWIGHRFKQKNGFKRSLVGSFLGSVTGATVMSFAIRSRRDPNIVELLVTFLAPQVGAVIGYNWR